MKAFSPLQYKCQFQGSYLGKTSCTTMADRNRRASTAGRAPARASGPSQTMRSVCTHYERFCQIVAPCCGAVVCCEKGHDAGRCPHKLTGKLASVTALVCGHCGAQQGVGNSCAAGRCRASFGEYGCARCRKWCAGEAFHCARCGHCHPGRRRDFTHCAVCRRCFPLATAARHVCAAGRAACAGCGRPTRGSPQQAAIMGCGHAMHRDCFVEHVKRSYACPRRDCHKTIAPEKVRALLAQVAAAAPAAGAPRWVYCRDCRRSSSARKAGGVYWCTADGGCGSHNTVPQNPGEGPVAPPRRSGR